MTNLLERMRSHPHIRVNETMPGVFACNFTRKAFYKGIWDQQTVKARGLFLDKDGNVLARGFDKFFGIGDHNGPTEEQFFAEVKYPVTIQRKENGFLAIVASVNGRLQVFSKSGVTDYSRHAEETIFADLRPEALDSLNTVLRISNMSLAVEVIDPYLDPHIELYDEPHGVILAGIKNQEKYELVDRSTMELIDSIITYMTISDSNYSLRMLDPNDRMNFTATEEKHINSALAEVETYSDSEGLIFRDATGKMWKYKTEWYKRVKAIRGSLQRTLKGETDETSGKIILALSEMGRNLADYRVTDIGGRVVFDLPRLAADLEPEFFFQDQVD